MELMLLLSEKEGPISGASIRAVSRFDFDYHITRTYWMFTCTGIVLVVFPLVALIEIVFVPASLRVFDEGEVPPLQPDRYSVPRSDRANMLAILGR